MHRLFVAFRPPEPIRRTLSAVMAGVAGARWQDDDQLHLTLRYIGEVDGGVADDIVLALAAIDAERAEATVRGVGRFEVRGRVNALWAGVTPRDPIQHIHRKIDAALVRIGLPPERRTYLPHITLARLNAPPEAVAAWLADHGGLTSGAFAIDEIRLYESHLGKVAARYDLIERFALR